MDRRTFLTYTALAAPVLPRPGARERAAPAPVLPPRAAVVATVRAVTDHWIANNSGTPSNEWAPATCLAGILAAQRLTGSRNSLDYARNWAESHDYGLNDGSHTRNADDQCAGQAYLDLFAVFGGDDTIAAIDESVHGMVTGDGSDDWWWVDALYMAMPVFARLGVLRGDPAYAETMFALYDHAKRAEGGGLYDTGAALWYRDGHFTPGGGGKRSPNGRPIRWSRGNGWALAAHATVLAALPATSPHVPEYRDTFTAMCRALLAVQRDDGFWNPNLADPDHVPCTETSGTALFTYGLAHGVRTGVLDRATYLPALARAWNGMVATAVHADGTLGWVQGVGSEPDSSQPVTADSTADFGVGAFLLAGSEVAALTGAAPRQR